MAGTNRCLEIIENYQEQRPSISDQLDFREELDGDRNYLTSIWKDPERLCEPDDRALLFHLLSREISTGNYDDPLTICRNLASNLDDLFFSRLLMQILRDEKRKRIDPHMILCWLETGDCLFSGNSTTISTKNYAILKLYYLCKNWKSKIECFSCGCVQKISVDLFLNNNCTRLNEALLSIVKSDFSNVDPTIRRLLHSFSDVRPIELFSYYIELLAEFHECALIEDLSGENAPARLIQLTGLLCEMKTDDIPEACSRVNRLLGQTSSAPQSGKKSSAAIETVLKCKLVPKIFECLMVMDSVKLENFSKRGESVQRFSVLVEKESYSISQQASIFFAPLQLLLFLYKRWDVWKKSRPLFMNKIDSLDLQTPQAPVIALYIISLIYSVDCSLLNHFVDFLEKQYPGASFEVKKTIMVIVEILEKLSSNPSIHAFFHENRTKTRILLATPLDSSQNVELVCQYLPDMTPAELVQFLQSNAKSLPSEYWNDVFRAIRLSNFYIHSELVWQKAMERKEEAIVFIENQLKVLIGKNERSVLKLRVGQVFDKLREVCLTSKLPHRELLISMVKLFLSFSPPQYCLLPPNTSKFLIPPLILAYCFFFERNEQQTLHLFRALLERFRGKENDSTTLCKDDPATCLDKICEDLQSTDISFIMKETFVQTLFEVTIDPNRLKMCKNPEEGQRIKERIAEMSSILFARLAHQLQKLGDLGKSPFCLLANIIEKHIQASSPYSSISKKICQRAMDGYACMTDKWNSMFVTSRVMKILSFSSNNPDLLEEVKCKIQSNQILLLALRTTKKKEFSQYEEDTVII